MTSIDSIYLNFEETRRRSELVWRSMKPEIWYWKPDKAALSSMEMVRHVLEGEHLYHKIIQYQGDLGDYVSPWEGRTWEGISEELAFAKNYRNDFMVLLRSCSPNDLHTVRIERKELNQVKFLGDYLNRMVYHEAVHLGQLLGYLRTFGMERPLIWD